MLNLLIAYGSKGKYFHMKTIIVCVILWTVVVVVADMNWPDHMGGSDTGLVNSILNLLI